MERSRLGALRSVSSRGVMATVEEQVEPQAGTSEKGAGLAAHPRIGIGLPMSNIFATYVYFRRWLCFNPHRDFISYFGGSLELVSLDGWGMLFHRETDSY
jgi:pyruvate dehydrogenase kinase 2/3/4